MRQNQIATIEKTIEKLTTKNKMLKDKVIEQKHTIGEYQLEKNELIKKN